MGFKRLKSKFAFFGKKGKIGCEAAVGAGLGGEGQFAAIFCDGWP